MRTTRISALLLGLSLIVFFATSSVRMSGQAGAAPAIDNDDIGGVVTGAQGPEAGVWVIAETHSTPTRLIKSVVTDDRGRFVVPDLPAGEYEVRMTVTQGGQSTIRTVTITLVDSTRLLRFWCPCLADAARAAVLAHHFARPSRGHATPTDATCHAWV